MSATDRVESNRRLAPILLLLSIGLCTFLTFLPVLRLGFLNWDDDRNIVHNEAFRGLGWSNLKWMFSTFQTGPYQPLSWLTLAIDYLIWGLKPFGYHLTNLLLHTISACLLFAVVARLAKLRTSKDLTNDSQPYILGAVVAILWSLHPLRTEPVAWATERRELLCGMLTLLTLLHELRAGRRSMTILLGCAAMLAKATAVALPVMLVALDIYRDQRYQRDLSPRLLLAALRRQAPLIIAAAAICALAVYGQRSAGTGASLTTLGIGARIVLFFNAIAFYVTKSLWPVGLTAFYPIPIICDTETRINVYPLVPAALAAAVASIVLAFVAIRRRDRIPWLLPLMVVYFAAVAPVSGLVQVGGQYAADRYAYQPTWIVTLAVVLGLAQLLPRSMPTSRIAFAAAPFAVVLALLSMRQINHWRDNISLWRRELAVFPDVALGHFNLAVACASERSDPVLVAETESHFRRAVELIPSYTEAWVGLAELLAATNRRESAVEYYATALQTRPSYLPAICGLAELLWSLDRKPEALDAMRMLVQYDPNNENARLQLAKALANAGQPHEATTVLESAIVAIPTAPVLRRNLIWLLSTHPDPAVRNGKRAMVLVQSGPTSGDWPDVVVAAAAYAETGDFPRAANLLDDVASKLDSQQAAAIKKSADQFRRGEPIRAQPLYP